MHRFFQNRWALGSLAPAVCIAFVLLDIALRFVPLDYFSFRAWEVVTLRHARLSPFGANLRYHNDRAHGELAAMANRPDLFALRAETFTTDAFGFRNSPNAYSNGPARGMLVGSSFSAGCGVNDDETLAVRLSQRLGWTIYNAAGFTPSLEWIRSVAHQLPLTSGIVFYEFYEANALPVSDEATRAFRARLPDWPILQVLNSVKVSRLKILDRRFCRRLENDRFLPRATPTHITAPLLRNGQPMLFANAADQSERSARVPKAGAYWSWLADELRKDNLSLVVFLVPAKYEVYRDLLQDRPPEAPAASSFLGQIERELRQRYIPVLNLESVLRKRADEDLARGIYLYRTDDTHWNPQGIDVAAEAIARLDALNPPALRPSPGQQ